MADVTEGLSTETQLLLPACGTTGKLRTAGESFGNTVGKTVARYREFVTLVGERSTKIKREKPLQLLAVLAATAFVAGFATRVWRMTRHA